MEASVASSSTAPPPAPRDSTTTTNPVDFRKQQELKGKDTVCDLESQTLAPVTVSPKITPSTRSEITPFTTSETTPQPFLRRRISTDHIEVEENPTRITPFENVGRNDSKGLFSTITKQPDHDDPFLDDVAIAEKYKKKMQLSACSKFHVGCMMTIVVAIVCCFFIPLFKVRTILGMQLWRWLLMILIFVCGGFLSRCMVRIAIFFIERNLLLHERMLYFVFSLRKTVKNCLWMTCVLVTWGFIVDNGRPVNKYLQYITYIFICLLIGSIMWFFKTLVLKILTMAFHVSKFFSRIQEALYNQYIIETLSGLPIHKMERNQQDDTQLIRGKSSRFSIGRLHVLNRNNISAWDMKKLISIILKGGFLSSLDEEHVEVKIKDKAWVRNEAISRAKKIQNNMTNSFYMSNLIDDLMLFMREDEVEKTIHLVEGFIESTRINEGALTNWVIKVFTERKSLVLSLKATKTAVKKIQHLLNVLIGAAIIIVWALVFRVSITHFLVVVSSQVLLLVFVFGNTFKTTFEAIIFLFVMHPFDIGDRCEIDGVEMTVEEMNLLTTVFLKHNNQMITYPNSVLAMKSIVNHYRSPDMEDIIEFSIHISTPAEKITAMKESIASYIEDKKEHWYPAPEIVTKDVEELNHLKFTIWVTHTMNNQDMKERCKRRGFLVDEIVKICRDLDIESCVLP